MVVFCRDFGRDRGRRIQGPVQDLSHAQFSAAAKGRRAGRLDPEFHARGSMARHRGQLGSADGALFMVDLEFFNRDLAR
jgi:hypothetical protein